MIANNVSIKGVVSCVPKLRLDNLNDKFIDEADKLVQATGIRYRHVVSEDTCTSDLCIRAAEVLMSQLNWKAEEIDCLIFVTQTPDYVLPATSNSIQSRLSLRSSTFCLDISLGCSGYIYAMSVCTAMLELGYFRKGLVLAGDTISKICSTEDKSTYPLFGDAGSATALQYCPGAPQLKFSFGSDGEGSDAIIVRDGGYRNPTTLQSFQHKLYGDAGVRHSDLQLHLNGMDVFSFGITVVPRAINDFLEKYSISKAAIDHYIFHQANLFMNERIRKKLEIPAEKVPYSLHSFGNTSSATIPLTMATQLSVSTEHKDHSCIACGFGVGLSWGVMNFPLKNVEILEFITYE